MAKMGKFDFSELKNFRDQLEKQLSEGQRREFIEECAGEIARYLKDEVTRRTPRGVYTGEDYECEGGLSHKGREIPGKRGGRLRGSWNIGITEWQGDKYVVEIFNDAKNDRGKPYASYVEYGHRTPNGQGWVPGHFMLELSKKEVEESVPEILRENLMKKLGTVFKE